MSTLFSLKDDIAVVVGGTGGLGGAIAQGLAEAGARVAVCGRSESRGNERVKAITDAGATAKFYPTNALSAESLEASAQAVTEDFGTPTILVNSAGGNDPKVTVTDQLKFKELNLEDWRAAFDLNVVGGFLLPCQVFGPAMLKAGRGSIINIASVSSHIPLSRVVAYSASKAAVLSLTMWLSREWAPMGVRVNSITPGFFPANQNRRLLYHEDGTPTPRTQAILSHTPMKRFGNPDELIGAAVYLASDRASGFVTGTDLRVDGGFLSQTI
ncbi:MAG: SDR family oxidoreductase [Verrucomicrobiota bacterium]